MEPTTRLAANRMIATRSVGSSIFVRAMQRITDSHAPDRDNRSGFSLIELLVVLGILSLLVALIPPVVSTTLDGQKVKGAVRELAAGLRAARGQAVATQQDVALALDVESRRYAVGARSHALNLPRDTQITLRTATTEQQTNSSGTIRFFPDGSATGGEITLTRGQRAYAIRIAWLTGRVTVVE